AQAGAQLWYRAEFQGILQNDGRVGGVVVRRAGEESSDEVQASLVVGADGAASLVRRALGIQAEVHHYRHGYLIALLPRPQSMRDQIAVAIVVNLRHGYLIALLPRPQSMRGEARYYVGRAELLGLFPAPDDRVVVLYMVEIDPRGEKMEALKARGLSALKSRVAAIDAAMTKPLESLTSWEHIGPLPCT